MENAIISKPAIVKAGLIVRLCLLLTPASFFLACSEPSDTQIVPWDPRVPLPDRLAEFSLFSDVSDLETASGSTIYEPLWPLWSNGTSKLRQLVMPRGATVEKTGDQAWDFPLGSLFFKTFSDQTGPIETRLIRNTAEGWEYAAYQWNAERNDAVRLDGRLSISVNVLLNNETFEHEIPSINQCKTCHESGASVILGYNPIQLGEQPLLSGTGDQLANQVIGYAYGNCTHCHNGSYMSDESGFSLLPEDFIANTVNHLTEGSGSAEGIRIRPGHPEDSVLYVSMTSDNADVELRSMPPLGVQRLDNEAIALLKTWIEHLE